MRHTLLLALAGVLLAGPTHAQEVSFYGFIKSETIHDTRQVAQVREGQFLLYPLASVDVNADGHDDNAQANLLMAAFQSRIGVRGTELALAGGQVTGTLEADFFGQNNSAVSMLRLRHANVQWTRGSHSVLAGQTWSPMFTPGLHPGVVGFATGAPFQPFARFPQLRYTLTRGASTLLLAASAQRDAFQEIGGSKMQQQSGQPAFHLQATTRVGPLILGGGATTKKILCELEGPSFRANATTIYGKWASPKRSVTAKAVLGDDLTDHLMTGGFLATSSGDVMPTRVQSFWLDMEQQLADRWVAGLFVGALANMGATGHEVDTPSELFTRAHDMRSLYRLSPRLSYTESSIRIALELEVTSARYSDSFDASFRPLVDDDVERVTNVRSLIAVYYHF